MDDPGTMICAHSLIPHVTIPSSLQYISCLVNNLHLDTALAQVPTGMQRIQCLLQRKRMADHCLEVQKPSSKALKPRRPSIAIPITKLDLNLCQQFESVEIKKKGGRTNK